MKPYIDKVENNFITRNFSKDINPIELMWHRDLDDRIIEIIDGDNQLLQLDNQLPILLQKNKKYNIPKLIYHRLIKSNTCNDLIIKIYE